MDEVDVAELAAGDHFARLLHERVAAVVEGHRVHDAGVARRVEQSARIARRHRQRLVGDDVLAPRERREDHGHVQVIRRRVVHDVDVGVGDERLVAPVRLRHAERIGLLPGGRLAARGNRDDLDKAEAADRVDVMGADETRAHEAHADTGGHESVLGARYMVLRPSKVHGPSSRAPRTLGPRTSDQGRTKD